MKPIIRPLALITAIAAVIMVAFNVWMTRTVNKSSTERNITINSIHLELSEIAADSDVPPDRIIEEKLADWKAVYGKSAPESITFVPLNDSSQPFLSYVDSSTSVCTLRNSSDNIIGIVLYSCKQPTFAKLRAVCIIIMFTFWLIICAVIIYTNVKILAPFKKLSEYPSHIAKIPTAEKLPESRNKYFGKFIWGMNMLTDVLQTERRQNEKLEYQRQTLIASIAHGVKTPVTNISLYADAIETGLYSDHVDIAQKIRNNTKKIEALTAELIGTASESVNAYVPEISKFYDYNGIGGKTVSNNIVKGVF